MLLGVGASLGAASLRPRLSYAAGLNPAVKTAVGEAVESAISAGACPGVSVAIWLRGEPLLSSGYGLANLETHTAVTPKSVFRIGSLTKQFTAAAVVKLASEGKLGLDDPVAKHLDFFSGREAVTLRELMTHTAGLHSDDDTPSGSPDKGPRSQIALARGIAAQPKLFDFKPGTAWLYSNANYIVLGAVIEAVARVSLARAMADIVFSPLGLANTAFDTASAIVPGRASGYTPVEGHAGAFVQATFIEVSEAGGAGAMRSTADDLCRWHHALLSNRLFGPRFVETMIAPGRLRDGRLGGANRFSPGDANYGDVQYALGLMIEPPSAGHPAIAHDGAIDGFAARLLTFTDVGLSIAVLCNADISPALPLRAIRRLAVDRILPHLTA
jgi:CubicO group peptidase (beta-lactamase class C family)